MSKKRLYEIAKELGKESKEIVQRAKELGLDVKSHSSSVEAAAADKIVASFASVKKAVTGASDAKAKPSTEPIKTEATPSKPAKDKTEQAANKPSPSPAPSPKPVEKAPATKQEQAQGTTAPKVTRPQSRNFKAEREARAKPTSNLRCSIEADPN